MGMGDIPNDFLKLVANKLTKTSTTLFKQILETEKFPKRWKWSKATSVWCTNSSELLVCYFDVQLSYLRPIGPLYVMNYKEWIWTYEIYKIAIGIDSKDDKVQCIIFLHVVGLPA